MITTLFRNLPPPDENPSPEQSPLGLAGQSSWHPQGWHWTQPRSHLHLEATPLMWEHLRALPAPGLTLLFRAGAGDTGEESTRPCPPEVPRVF